MRSSSRVSALLALCVAAFTLPAISASALVQGVTPNASAGSSRIVATTTDRVEARADSDTTLHRVVWDEYRRGRNGIHLRSARVDGTDVRAVYDSPSGFTLNPTLDGEGRRVAFGTCCRDSFPQLVVVSARGGKAREPLSRQQELFAVGGIGWSPNGKRLAFEGYSGSGEDQFKGIWTVRPSGRDLDLVMRLPVLDQNGQPVINDALGWTSEGILYSDGTDLRSARNGRSQLILRNVNSVRLSGNQRRIVVRRDATSRRPPSVWVSRTDGTRLKRMLVQRPIEGGFPFYKNVTPNYDGSQMLSWRSEVPPLARTP
jgi:hypothetical protein